jgi:hypothetical protein
VVRTSAGGSNFEQRCKLAEACRPASEIIAGDAQTANLFANARIIAGLVWTGSNSTFYACAVPASQFLKKILTTRKLILRFGRDLGGKNWRRARNVEHFPARRRCQKNTHFFFRLLFGTYYFYCFLLATQPPVRDPCPERAR